MISGIPGLLLGAWLRGAENCFSPNTRRQCSDLSHFCLLDEGLLLYSCPKCTVDQFHVMILKWKMTGGANECLFPWTKWYLHSAHLFSQIRWRKMHHFLYKKKWGWGNMTKVYKVIHGMEKVDRKKALSSLIDVGPDVSQCSCPRSNLEEKKKGGILLSMVEH